MSRKQANKQNYALGSGETRTRRNRGPRIQQKGEDGIVVRGASLGHNAVFNNTAGGGVSARYYIPGYMSDLSNTAAAGVSSFYSTGVFKPGTKVRWEPNLSPLSGGRVFVGFTDNPEIIADISTKITAFVADSTTVTYNNVAVLVKGLGNVISFPAYVEKEIDIPARTRRKRFDVNETVTTSDVNVLDRCCQTAMFSVFDGLLGMTSPTAIGGFWYHDVVDLEGLTNAST